MLYYMFLVIVVLIGFFIGCWVAINTYTTTGKPKKPKKNKENEEELTSIDSEDKVFSEDKNDISSRFTDNGETYTDLFMDTDEEALKIIEENRKKQTDSYNYTSGK